MELVRRHCNFASLSVRCAVLQHARAILDGSTRTNQRRATIWSVVFRHGSSAHRNETRREPTEAAETAEFTTKKRSKRRRTEGKCPSRPADFDCAPDGWGTLFLVRPPFASFLRCELRYLRDLCRTTVTPTCSS